MIFFLFSCLLLCLALFHLFSLICFMISPLPPLRALLGGKDSSLGYPYSNGTCSQSGTLTVRVWDASSTCKVVMRSGISAFFSQADCPSNVHVR
ncbi:hypothetical protein GALMADRAFT_1074433 [Galerina marginata CBS 339.88]|uniref:Uncharacterized protein n=1 Tax=Galerina marginata (strain CBS 339.88) TaxID=685588 RepID=A0A067S9Y9_GALM3|nr:hypothetical protein GALMADRAFT_1074433 [Galerina marginata CBS 339.88]